MVFDPSAVADANKKTITLDSSIVSGTETDVPIPLVLTDVDIFSDIKPPEVKSVSTWYANNSYGAPANLEDGDLATYVQAFTYCCGDFGEAFKLKTFRFAVHNSTAWGAITGKKLQGSNDTTNGSDGTWTDLYTFDASTLTAPASYPGWCQDTIEINATTAYRYYRLTGGNQTSEVWNEWELISSDLRKKIAITDSNDDQLPIEINPDEWDAGGYAANADTTLNIGSNWTVEKQLRTLIDGSRITSSGGKIKLNIGSYTYGATIASVYIGKSASAGSTDFDGNQVEVTFNGESSGFSLTGTDSIISDEIEFDVTAGDELLIAFSWLSASGIGLAYSSQSGATTKYGTSGVAGDTTFSATGTYNSTQAFVTSIEIEESPKAVIWTKVPSYAHDADTELTFHFDSSQDDNDDYVGVLGEDFTTGGVDVANVDPTYDSWTGTGTYHRRQFIDSSLIEATSTDKFRIKLLHGGSGTVTLSALWIGLSEYDNDGSANRYDFEDGTQVQVTKDGSNTITWSGEEYTDEFTLPAGALDGNRSIVLAYYNTTAIPRQNSSPSSTFQWYFTSGSPADCGTADVTGGMQQTQWHILSELVPKLIEAPNQLVYIERVLQVGVDVIDFGNIGADTTSVSTRNWRTRISASIKTERTNSKIRIKFLDNATWTLDDCYIGYSEDEAVDTEHFSSGTQVQVTKGGETSFTISSGDNLSDEIELPVDGDKGLVIAFHTTSQDVPRIPTVANSGTYYADSATSTSADDDPGSMTKHTSKNMGIEAVIESDYYIEEYRNKLVLRPQDPSGSVYESVTGNEFTVNGTMTADDLIDGVIGKALDFDGANDYLYHAHDAAFEISGQELTIFAQFQHNDTGWNDLISFSSSTTSNYDLVRSTTRITYFQWSNSGWKNHTDAGFSAEDTWYSISVTYDAGAIQFGNDAVFSVEDTGNSALQTSATNNLHIGHCPFGSLGYANIKLAILILSDVKRSQDYITILHEAMNDNIATWSAFSGGGTSLVAYCNLLYKLEADLVAQLAYLDAEYGLKLGTSVDLSYSLLAPLAAYLDEKYGLKLGTYLTELYWDAPTISRFVDLPYKSNPELKRILEIVYGDRKELVSFYEFLYSIRSPLLHILTEYYSITEKTILNSLEENYELEEKVKHKMITDLVYAITRSSVVDISSLTATVGGTRIYPSLINFEYNVHSFVGSCEFQTNNQADTIGIIPYETELVIQDGLETFTFLAEPPRKSRTVKETKYVIEGVSKAILLERSEAYTKEYPGGMASELAASIGGEVGVTVTWEAYDWYIPAKELYANDETPIEVLRKLTGAIGAVIQSTPSGEVVVRKYMEANVPDWPTAAPTYYLTDQQNFFTTSENYHESEGYNKYEISDHIIPDRRMWLDEEEINSTSKWIKGFHVPFTDQPVVLQHSGGDWVRKESYGTQTETITEVVEIVKGEGKTSKPIYSLESKQYLQVNLGNITYSEEGILYTEVTEQSLVEVTYTTKYRLWKAFDNKIEEVQFYLEAD